MLPTTPTSAERFWPISVASMSNWMIRASAGTEAPNRSRKSSGEPTNMKTSHSFIAWRRVRLKNCGWSARSMPRPMPLR